MLLLIDGQSLLYTMFYATLPKSYLFAKTWEDKAATKKLIMQNSEGLYTNGVYGMTKKLLKIIKTIKPRYITVAWDKSRNTFRREIYPAYKENRNKIKPELAQQIGLMQNILSAMGITQFDHPNYEADDLIGTLARKFQNEVSIRILTKDRDAMQLVSNQSYVWLMNGNKETNGIPDGSQQFDPAAVKETFGVYPKQFPDLKALAGDSSDNIPGVPGVGEKTAVPLLSEFNSIEELYSFIENPKNEEGFKFLLQEMCIKRSPLKQLLKHKDSAFMSKQLAVITDVPMDVKLARLEYAFNIPELELLFNRLEFSSLIRMIA